MTDEGRVEVPAGSLLHLPAGFRHKPDYELGQGLLFFALGWTGPNLPLAPGQVLSDPDRRATYLLNWMRDHRGAESSPKDLLQAQLETLLAWVSLGGGADNRALDVLGRMTAYMRRNLQSDINAEIISATEQIHLPQAERLFRAELGVSIHNHLQRLRVDTAVDLIRRTTLSLSEIGRQTGLPSRAHLARLVKERYGCTTQHLRRPVIVAQPQAWAPEESTEELHCAVLFGRTQLKAKDFPDPSRPMLRTHHALWRVLSGSVTATLGGCEHLISTDRMFISMPGDRVSPSAKAVCQVVVFDTGGQLHGNRRGGYLRLDGDMRPDPPLSRFSGPGEWTPLPGLDWIRTAAQPFANILEGWYRNAAGWRTANADLAHHLALHLEGATKGEPLDRCAELFLGRLSRKEPVAELARRAGLGMAALNRRCLAQHQKNLGSWLEDLRLEHACRLLATTVRTVTAIAADCGYVSPSSFIRRFRQRFEVTPKTFRTAAVPPIMT